MSQTEIFIMDKNKLFVHTDKYTHMQPHYPECCYVCGIKTEEKGMINFTVMNSARLFMV